MLRNTTFTWVTAVILSALVSGALAREKADLSPENLKEIATHVITGKVGDIYTMTTSEDDWKYTRHVAEVLVATVEKGEGLKAGDLVYARYWTRRWTGFSQMPPSTTGHRGLPEKDESLRIYLARNAYEGFYGSKDGGYNVVGANGFERLPKPAGK